MIIHSDRLSWLRSIVWRIKYRLCGLWYCATWRLDDPGEWVDVGVFDELPPDVDYGWGPAFDPFLEKEERSR